MKTLKMILVVVFCFGLVDNSFSDDLWEMKCDTIPGSQNLLVTNSGNIYVSRSGYVIDYFMRWYSSSDLGTTWNVYESQPNPYSCMWRKKAPNGNLFARIDSYNHIKGELFKSIDDGGSWEKSGLPDTWGGRGIEFQKSIDDTFKIVAWDLDRLYLSTNGGASFKNIEITNQTSSTLEGINVNSKGDIYTIQTDSSYYYVYKTMNNGENWVKVFTDTNFSGYSYKKLFISSDDDLYIIVNNNLDEVPNKLIRSIDNGKTWKTVYESDYNQGDISGIVENSNKELFISRNGVYGTSDKGETWKSLGLDTISISNIALDTQDFLYAVGYIIGKVQDGPKLYRTNKSVTQLKEFESENIIHPNSPTLSQNYPNPFNPSTSIEFSLPKSELTTLKVYNILGKEVATLVSNKLNQGNHTYTFDGKNLASGIYYYQLVAGDFHQVKKMILLR